MSALNTKSGLNRLFPFAKKKPNIPVKLSDKVDPKSNKLKSADDNNILNHTTSESIRCDILTENVEKSYGYEISKESLSETTQNDGSDIKPKIKKSVTRKSSNASVISIDGIKKPKENYHRWNIPFSSKFKGKDFDKTLLTMQDLIYYNPVSNPIIKEAKIEKFDEDDPDNDLLSFESDKKPSISNNCITPCIKVGADGKIMIDQETLTLNETGFEEKREELAKAKVIEESAFQSRYSSYKRKQAPNKQWSKDETLKFYKCLMNLGTDFSMIQQYFPSRNRAQIKRKYKLEEKKNPQLINGALSNTIHYDSVLMGKMFQEDKTEIVKEINSNADSEVSSLLETENNKNLVAPKETKSNASTEITTKRSRKPHKRLHTDVIRSQCGRMSVCAYMMEEEIVLKKKRKVPIKNSTIRCAKEILPNAKKVINSLKKKRGRKPLKNKEKTQLDLDSNEGEPILEVQNAHMKDDKYILNSGIEVSKKRRGPNKKTNAQSNVDLSNIDNKKEPPLKVRRLQDFHDEYIENISKYENESSNSD